MGSEIRENAFDQISKSELETKLAEANEKNLKLELKLSETKRMYDAQIKSLNLKQQESEEKIRTLEQTCDVLCAKLAVENDTIELMRYSVSQVTSILRDIGEMLFHSGAIGVTFRQLLTHKIFAINQNNESSKVLTTRHCINF